ncbi:type VI secretion system baseplate subunit TssE [Limnoglobus roseus]|uniref:Type VI secretion system baseplate subunit TssE n=1 Tax=Limnoglobus roseus TaxID=2598579 RepID=A0A5C1AJ35_9BACT|nr:type VI secretion system baseplate subunit TssE [Limnoglobus roseus]QEL19459.1 type VI secretion system baseplate subunit TssE [Limnoglobus roseus]
MPTPALPTALTPSVFDRLTDPEAGGPGLRIGYTLSQMMTAVRIDLEELLNTHSPYEDVPAEFPLVADSVLTYGLPDVTALPAAGDADKQRLGYLLAGIIARHEPRLIGVTVTLLDGESRSDLQVQFRIDARLAVDPSPEVGFVTVMDIFSGATSVNVADD